MANTRTAAQSDAEENSDGLEIISIGSLYKGPWDKKYWTSSRGKDRYPFPVGYQAVRAHNGTTYKMEIHEGVNGPMFLISSDDESSSSGKTPDFAWEEFQKKGCPRMKIWHGKRLSSKMDGLELFGFKNPFVQRLLRELVSDINGIAEQSSASPNFYDGFSRADHDDCRPNIGAFPDLLLCLEKPSVTGKRSRCELRNKNLNGGARPRSVEVELMCSKASNVKNEKSLGQERSTTHYGLGEENGIHNHNGVSMSLEEISSIGKSSNCISSNNGSLLNPTGSFDEKKEEAVPSERPTGFLNSTNCKTTELTENLSTEEPLHRSLDVELKTSEDKTLMHSCCKESEGCVDIDLCAPDTRDFVHENTADSPPSKLDKNNYCGIPCEITSGDFFNAEQEELLKADSNPRAEKSCFHSADQDVEKSMMSLLLPQAVPLLRNVSIDKELTISPSDMLPCTVNSKEEQNEVGFILDVPSSEDVVMAEAAYGEQGEKIHGPNTETHSNTCNSEHMKSFVPDSFDYSQCEDLQTNKEILSSSVDEAGRSCFNKEICSLRSQEQLPGCDLPNNSSTCHVTELEFKDRPQDCDICIPESVPDGPSPKDRILSERMNDAYSNMKENALHVGFNSKQKDLSTAQDFIKGVSNTFLCVQTKSCNSKSTETHAEKPQDEVVGKTGNAETMSMSSSQSPSLVYTRRKLRNAIPLRGNSLAGECTVYDKSTAEATLPLLETIKTNSSNNKTCEQDDSASLHVEKPQTHADVLCGHSNLIELNPTSSQNATLFDYENKCFDAKEPKIISERTFQKNQELKNNLSSSVKFVGRYMHPMPVSSLFLSTREEEIHVCVLCGLLMDQYRTIFTYKVSIKEPRLGRPSVMAHTPILLPDPKHDFIKETMVERSGVQLTPYGQYIILTGRIKTPCCREGKIDCSCSTCTPVCSQKNSLKIVQVEHGYVSVVATLETADNNVHCVLVCEPNRLVSVGESGMLQVWVMNSTWSEKIECFIIPADGSISPGIVELKRVPRCSHLVVGHNRRGEFSIWDIAKLTCVSSFSASKNPIVEFFPISLYHWQEKGSGFSYDHIGEHADELLEATDLWYSEQSNSCSFLPSDEDDIAMWLLVSTTSDFNCSHDHVSTSSHYDIHTARSWRLALLVKDSVIFGSPLDPRTSGIDVSRGYGIMGTSDGEVYMWELSRGSKLGTLHHFQDDTVTCVATDDSGGAFGVAGGGGQLLLYLHLPELDSLASGQ